MNWIKLPKPKGKLVPDQQTLQLRTKDRLSLGQGSNLLHVKAYERYGNFVVQMISVGKTMLDKIILNQKKFKVRVHK